MIFREILNEDYRSFFERLIGGYRDPEKVLQIFDRFWETLIKQVETKSYKYLPWPKRIDKSTVTGFVFWEIDKYGGRNARNAKVIEIKVDKCFVYLTDIELIDPAHSKQAGATIYVHASTGNNSIMVANCNMTSDASLLADMRRKKSDFIHEFVHLTQSSFGIFDNWKNYNDQAKEHEAHMVEFSAPYYEALHALQKNSRAKSNNSFFTTGKFVDFVEEFFTRNVPMGLRISLIKSGKVTRAYKYFSQQFSRYGGKPAESDAVIDAAISRFLKANSSNRR